MISAAFIGPGTLTTAASSGATYRFELVWVLLLSTIICMVLQINVTKITIETGKTFGEHLLQQFKRQLYVPITIGFSIVFGCMAYQAGNLLGAGLGLGLVFGLNQSWTVLMIGLSAGLLLWFGTVNLVVRILGIVVACMGLAFIYIVFSMDLPVFELLEGVFIPGIPDGSEILVMGLVGTTIVPYNLFLGSGLSKGKSFHIARIGLIGAIAIGGIISIAVLLAGSLVDTPMNFEKLADALTSKLGMWARYLLAFGLFAAGFTSSITAPIAAIFTLKSIFPHREDLNEKSGMGYRSVWMIVMFTGLLFAMANIKPIPLIILAQAVNGIILPFIVCSILWLTLSTNADRGYAKLNSTAIVLAIVSFVIILIAAFNLAKLMGQANISGMVCSALLGLVVVAIVVRAGIIKRPDRARQKN